MTDIVAAIKASVNPAEYDFTTAEGRVAFDDALRAALVKIEDDHLRSHAAGMLKAWRRELMPLTDDLSVVMARLSRIEDHLGVGGEQPVTDLRRMG